MTRIAVLNWNGFFFMVLCVSVVVSPDQHSVYAERMSWCLHTYPSSIVIIWLGHVRTKFPRIRRPLDDIQCAGWEDEEVCFGIVCIGISKTLSL